MPQCIAIINGTRYRIAEDVYATAHRIESTFRGEGREVQLPIETDDGHKASLHLLPGSVGSFAVYEANED